MSPSADIERRKSAIVCCQIPDSKRMARARAPAPLIRLDASRLTRSWLRTDSSNAPTPPKNSAWFEGFSACMGAMMTFRETVDERQCVLGDLHRPASGRRVRRWRRCWAGSRSVACAHPIMRGRVGMGATLLGAWSRRGWAIGPSELRKPPSKWARS